MKESPRQTLYIKLFYIQKPKKLFDTQALPPLPSLQCSDLLACLGVQTPSLSQRKELGPLQAILGNFQAILAFLGSFWHILASWSKSPLFLLQLY